MGKAAAFDVMAERNEFLEGAVKESKAGLLRFIRKRVNSRQDAEDVMQDVFAQLTAAWDITEPINRISAWLYKAARNRIVDLYRRKKDEPWPDEAAGAGDDEKPVMDNLLPDLSSSPDVQFERSLVWDAFEEALDELPPGQHEVFVMHEMEGLSFKEISLITGVGQSTLISRKHYAILHLRSRLRDFYSEIINPKINEL